MKPKLIAKLAKRPKHVKMETFLSERNGVFKLAQYSYLYELTIHIL